MNNVLKYPKFKVAAEKSLEYSDFYNLRTYYGPVMGSLSVFLYEILNDSIFEYGELEKKLDFAELATNNKILLSKLDIARLKLMTLGLLEIYQNDDEKELLFLLKKPKNLNEIKNNQLLQDLLIKALGAEKTKLLLQEKKKSSAKWLNFQNVTLSSAEIFGVTEATTKSVDLIYERLLENKYFDNLIEKFNDGNLYRAILKESFPEFYLTFKTNEPWEQINRFMQQNGRLLNNPLTNLLAFSFYATKGFIDLKSLWKIVQYKTKYGRLEFYLVEEDFLRYLKNKKSLFAAKYEQFRKDYIESLKNH
ncbi:hypothetical protein [Mycoplasmopsis columbinasalis]|uniref:DnaD domain-containing protein n=1 Tax=Mycoplasmopsis columbinasalis TaxID=114880 RepID=A0A449BAW3_9BACT|nr:hypothetical protein [Mycoplasmopsis columbinasalis]VEU78336.1 DnaD domain-containing protein [Mycoplasmopsis columbinasalis]